MARPIWKGHISFGLINVPVVLYNGERRSDLQFRLLDSRDQARVRYERVNEVTGAEVPWQDVVKGYEYEDGNFVLLTEEDFKHAAPEASQTVEIEDFVKQDEIALPYFDTPYFLVPGKKAEKGYVLLRETLKAAGVVGIARVVIRTREYLAAVIVRGDALCLDLMRYDQELRKPDEFDLPDKKPADYKISKKELDMAQKLVDGMTIKWDPSHYEDEYRSKLLAWIEKKAESDGEVRPPEPQKEDEPSGKIIDFMELLQKSMRQKQKDRPVKSKSNGKSRTVPKTVARASSAARKRKSKAS